MNTLSSRLLAALLSGGFLLAAGTTLVFAATVTDQDSGPRLMSAAGKTKLNVPDGPMLIWPLKDTSLFADVAPTAVLWVRQDAPPDGDGSYARPFATIQSATAVATAGTAVLVRAGTYNEAVKLPSRRGGSDDAPIWYISADGIGKAKIVTPPEGMGAFVGFGVKNIAVMGFDLSRGGGTGSGIIHFGMSGRPSDDPALWKNPDAFVRNVLVRANIVHDVTGAKADGIKISQADGIEISDNRIWNVSDQCIDFVAVNDGKMLRNDCSNATNASAMFAKMGSRDIEVAYNNVHDIPVKVDGISLAGRAMPASRVQDSAITRCCE